MNFKHRENVNKILDDIKKITDNDAELNYITDLVRAIELLQEQITDLENEKASECSPTLKG
jgi:polyhydroxyalkanoate synthesis regulator phasin